MAQQAIKINWGESFGKTQKTQLDTLKKTHALKINWNDALGIDTKPKKTNSSIDAYYDALTRLEYNGPNGLTSRTNNPVATLYTQELAEKFGATKGPALPSGDNPENRPLFTAVFPDIETGTAAGKYIVQNIYNNAGGDVEKFASIYSMGKLPNQLIDSNEIAVKDRYVKALLSSTSKDDLAVTLKRQEDDVSQAVIDETQRLIKGDDLFRDSSDISRIFDPTTRMLKDEPVDITDFAQPSTTKTGADDPNSLIQFEESKIPIVAAGEGIKYSKKYTQLEEEAVKANTRFSISNELQAPTGLDEFKTYWSNTFGVNPDDSNIKALAVNTISGAAEIMVGFSDLKDKAIQSIATGEGGIDFAKEFIAGFAATPEILADLIVAAGINPLPAYNNSTPEGKERVLKAQKEVWNNPLLPFLAATGFKAAGKGLVKAPVAIKTFAKKAKKTINDANAISEAALKIAKGEANKADYSFAVNRLAEKITNPAVYESTINILKEAKPYKRDVKGGYSPAQINAALKEINMLAENFFETTNTLQNPYVSKFLTGGQINGLQNSANQLRLNILKQAKIVGDDSTISYLHTGFGISKLEAKVALEYIKNIGRGYGQSILPKNILNKMMGHQKREQYFAPDKKLPASVEKAFEHVKKTSDENKLNKELNSNSWKKFRDGTLYREGKANVAKFLYNTGAQADMAIDLAIKGSTGNWSNSMLLKQIRIEKQLLQGTSAISGMKIQQLESAIYSGLNRKEMTLLNDYIMIRRERSLKKYHDTELANLNNQLKVETKKPEIKKIKDEIKRINNYKYSGGDAWTTIGVADDYLKQVSSKSMSSKVKNAADAYFNVFREMIDEMEFSGLISKKEAIKYKSRDYSPKEYLKFMHGEKTYNVSGKKITVTDRGIKKLREGDEGVLNDATRELLYDTIKSTQVRIANNNVNNMLSKVLKDGEIEGIGYLLKNANTKTKPGYVRVEYFDDGAKKAIALNENFAEGWIKSDPIVRTKYTNALGHFLGTSLLKASATGYNPLFALVNIPRDMAYVTLTEHGLYSNVLPKAYGQLFKDMVKESSNAWSKKGSYVDYINEGGGMHFLSSGSKFGDPFSPVNNSFWKTTGAMLGKIGEYSEIVTRLAVRRRAIKNGLSPREATAQARRYLDFNNKGQITNAIESFVPYSAATVQASRGILRSAIPKGGFNLKKGKIINKDFAIKSSQIIGLKYMIDTYIDASEERREIMTRVPDDVKFKNFVMPLPFKVNDKTGRSRNIYIKIPKDGGQSLVTGIYDIANNMYNKTETSSYNMDQLDKIVGSLSPYEVSQLAPLISIWSIGNNRKFPWLTKIYKGDDRVDDAKLMTNLDEQLIYKDIAGVINASPAKVKYSTEKLISSGNLYFDIGTGGWDYLRSQLSEEELNIFDNNFTKFLDIPASNVPGLRQIPKRFIGFAEDLDFATKHKAQELEIAKANMEAANNIEVNAFILNYRALPTEKQKQRALKQYNEWAFGVLKSQGENEFKRIADRFEQQKLLDNLDVGKGFIEFTINKSPQVRAGAIYDLLINKYDNDIKKMRPMLIDLIKASPRALDEKGNRTGERTGVFNKETQEYFISLLVGAEAYNLIDKKKNKELIKIANEIFNRSTY